MATWNFKQEIWERESKSGKFRLIDFQGKPVSADLNLPLNLLFNCKVHPKPLDKCSSSYLPNDFEYCPDCGAGLVAPNQTSSKWVPPYGPSNGLKVIDGNLDLNYDSGTEFVLPSSSGHFDFVVGYFTSKKRVLVSLQRDIGRLFVYASDSNKMWVELPKKIAPSKLPSWSWASALDKNENFWFVPTDKGPLAINFDFLNNKYNFCESFGKSIGGVTVFNNIAYAPILEKNRIQFLKFLADGKATEWSKLDSDCEITNPEEDSSESNLFGVPVIDEDRDLIYWPMRNGYFTMEVNTNTIKYSQWEYDQYPAKALIELGCPFRKNGSRSGFWQLCEDYDPTSRDKVVYKVLKLGGNWSMDYEIVQAGQFITTGYSSFSWFYDFWEDIHKRSPGTEEQSELRYPILQSESGNKFTLIAKLQDWPNKEHDFVLFTDLFNNKSNKDQSFVRFVMEGAGMPEHPLFVDGIAGNNERNGSLFSISVSELSELRAFIYDRKLHIYMPEKNEAYCWNLN